MYLKGMMFLPKVKYWELKEEAEDRSLSIKQKEEIQIIFHKSMDLLTSNIIIIRVIYINTI